MEVIDLSGYTMEEKVQIATTHLVPKQRRLHALEHDPQAKPPEGTVAEVAEETSAASPAAKSEVPTMPEEPLLRLTETALQDLLGGL